LEEKIDAGRVAARSGKAGNKTKFHRVFANAEDDRNRICRSFSRERSGRGNGGGDYGDAKLPNRSLRSAISSCAGFASTRQYTGWLLAPAPPTSPAAPASLGPRLLRLSFGGVRKWS
jgi:hypothetical protein